MFLRFFLEQIQDLLASDAANFHAFQAALRAALNSNSRLCGFQKIGEEFDERIVGVFLNGPGAETNFQGAGQGAGAAGLPLLAPSAGIPRQWQY